MFRDIIDRLAKGDKPEKRLLTRKLDAALTKKIGVLQISFLSQPADPKINPPSRQLLLVAAFLGEREKIQLALDILRTEQAQRHGSIKAVAAHSALTEALETTSRLLAAFPSELIRWRQVLAELENIDMKKE